MFRAYWYALDGTKIQAFFLSELYCADENGHFEHLDDAQAYVDRRTEDEGEAPTVYHIEEVEA